MFGEKRGVFPYNGVCTSQIINKSPRVFTHCELGHVWAPQECCEPQQGNAASCASSTVF